MPRTKIVRPIIRGVVTIFQLSGRKKQLIMAVNEAKDSQCLARRLLRVLAGVAVAASRFTDRARRHPAPSSQKR
jgi:hypothetical protein